LPLPGLIGRRSARLLLKLAQNRVEPPLERADPALLRRTGCGSAYAERRASLGIRRVGIVVHKHSVGFQRRHVDRPTIFVNCHQAEDFVAQESLHVADQFFFDFLARETRHFEVAVIAQADRAVRAHSPEAIQWTAWKSFENLDIQEVTRGNSARSCERARLLLLALLAAVLGKLRPHVDALSTLPLPRLLALTLIRPRLPLARVLRKLTELHVRRTLKWRFLAVRIAMLDLSIIRRKPLRAPELCFGFGQLGAQSLNLGSQLLDVQCAQLRAGASWLCLKWVLRRRGGWARSRGGPRSWLRSRLRRGSR
jgi:hypothetical protein